MYKDEDKFVRGQKIKLLIILIILVMLVIDSLYATGSWLK